LFQHHAVQIMNELHFPGKIEANFPPRSRKTLLF
jgi:hypothetical protein